MKTGFSICCATVSHISKIGISNPYMLTNKSKQTETYFDLKNSHVFSRIPLIVKLFRPFIKPALLFSNLTRKFPLIIPYDVINREKLIILKRSASERDETSRQGSLDTTLHTYIHRTYTRYTHGFVLTNTFSHHSHFTRLKTKK